jgi:hypothetical protein
VHVFGIPGICKLQARIMYGTHSDAAPTGTIKSCTKLCLRRVVYPLKVLSTYDFVIVFNGLKESSAGVLNPTAAARYKRTGASKGRVAAWQVSHH